MKGSRFSEEQIIGVLRESEAGAKTEEVCRRHGISSATFYIYGRLPHGKKVRAWSGDDRLQTSIRRHPMKVRPNGTSAHTLLDKWSASRAIIEVRV